MRFELAQTESYRRMGKTLRDDRVVEVTDEHLVPGLVAPADRQIRIVAIVVGNALVIEKFH